MAGYSNTRIGSQPNKYLIDASNDTPVKAAESGMVGTADQPISLTPVTANATEVYSRNKQPKNVSGLAVGDQFKVNDKPQFLRIVADGVKTVWSILDLATLVNLTDIGNQAAVDADEKLTLRNVVEANGVVLTPVGNDTALTGGDCRVITNGGDLEIQAEKVGGGAFGEGTCLDIHMDFSNNQITTTVLAAGNQGVPLDGIGAHYWRADNDVVAHREYN